MTSPTVRHAKDAASALEHELHELTQEEQKILKQLRQLRRHRQSAPRPRTIGQKVADGVAAAMGSWPFILVQSALLAAWIVLNVTAWIQSWDPYPFILLNLMLSFQAAYAAPFIMMSQNRQAEIDRAKAAADYDINVKAELEVELLHYKLDHLRRQEIQRLTKIIEDLVARIEQVTPGPVATSG